MIWTTSGHWVGTRGQAVFIGQMVVFSESGQTVGSTGHLVSWRGHSVGTCGQKVASALVPQIVKGFTQVVTGAGHWVLISGQVVTTGLTAQTVACGGIGQTVATPTGQTEGSDGHLVVSFGQLVGNGQIVVTGGVKQAVATLGQSVGAIIPGHIVPSAGQLLARIGQVVAGTLAGHWVFSGPVQAVNTFGQVVAARPPAGQTVATPTHVVGAVPGQLV